MTRDPAENDANEPEEPPSDESAVAQVTPQEIDPDIADVVRQVASAINESTGVSVSSELSVLSRSGPLPPPEMLHEYNEMIPDGANRIMLMAEKAQAAHISDRQESRRAERRGQLLAFACVLSVLATGLLLAAVGQGIESLTVSVSGLAAMVYAFVRGRG